MTGVINFYSSLKSFLDDELYASKDIFMQKTMTYQKYFLYP